MSTILGTVFAVNTDPDSENRIHSDLTARKYGFEAGLVPGVEIFAYLAGAALSRHPSWLTSGTGSLELRRPYYDGEPVTISADGSTISADDRATLRVGSHQERTALASIPRVELRGGYNRAVASAEVLAAGSDLGTLHIRFNGPRGGLPFSRRATELLELANQILMRNFLLDPWLHVASDVRWYEQAAGIEAIEVRGRVEREWETRKGHRMVRILVEYCHPATLELAASIHHTAIWQLKR